LDCEHVKHRGNRFEAQLPDQFNSSNVRSVQVYENKSLSSAVRSRGVKGDIYTLVAYLMTENEDETFLNKQLYKAKNKIINVLNLDFKSIQTEEKDTEVHNSWLKELKEKRSQTIDLSTIEKNPPLPESVLDEFVHAGHINWVRDNIPLHVQEEFEVCFDIQSERICLPTRDKGGRLVGVKGRSTRKEDEEKYKYLPIYAFQKSKELFNLHRAIDYIRASNTIILFESEKSCLKAHGFEQYNTASQMGSDLSKIQAAIIKNISPELNIILCFDSDKSVKEIKNMAKVFGKYENLYAVYDKVGLLNKGESPVDQTKEVWQKLLKHYCYKIPNK